MTQHAAECVEELLNTIREEGERPWFLIIENKMNKLANSIELRAANSKLDMAESMLEMSQLLDETMNTISLYINVPELHAFKARWENLKNEKNLL